MVMLGKGLATAMNARIVGSGDETLILAHGYGGDQSVWDKVLPDLAMNYQVLVFDWSFSGAIKLDPNTLFDSVKCCSFDGFADDVITLVDEMRLSSSVFVGHSMAGIIGCIASIKRPELFKTLILLGSSPRYINSDDYEGGFEKAVVDEILSSIEFNFENWASSFASIVVDPNDPHSVQKFEKCMKKMRPEIALSVGKLIFLSDERDTLEKVTVPCTIIQTTNDVVVPNSVPDYIAKKIKGKSRVEIVDAIGHFPQLTAHTMLLEVLDRVLGDVLFCQNDCAV